MAEVSVVEVAGEAFKALAERATLRVADLPAGLHQVRGANAKNPRLGSNGAGKSTFFSDLVTWVLYGRTAGGLRTTDVRSWLVKGAPQGTVTVRRGGREHAVQRGPRASDLDLDGEAVGQADVEALVGLSFDAWRQAVVLGQGRPLFFDLPPRDKMTLLSDALGLERWERRARAASDRAGRLEARGASMEGEVRGMELARDHARDAQSAAQIAARGWGASHAARAAETAEAAKSLRAAAQSLEAARDRAAVAADSAGSRARLLRPAVDATRGAVGAVGEAVRAAAGHCARLDAELERAEADLAAAAPTRGAGVCPTCAQPLKKHAGELVARLRAAARRLKAELETARGAHDAAREADDELRAKLEKDEADLRGLEALERDADAETRRLEREFGAARGQAEAAEAEAARVEKEENPHRAAEAGARARLRELESDVKDKTTLLERVRASAERAQFWARGFREIRLGVIDEVLDDLRGTTAEVLEGLGLGEWEVEYATEREKKSGGTTHELTVGVRSPDAPEGVRWESYSGGECQRLRLAGALALSEVLLAHAGVALDFRVLDEPTRGLSPEGVGDLVEVLADYAERAGLKIFLIDHMALESSKFASKVVVEQGTTGSRLRVG